MIILNAHYLKVKCSGPTMREKKHTKNYALVGINMFVNVWFVLFVFVIIYDFFDEI